MQRGNNFKHFERIWIVKDEYGESITNYFSWTMAIVSKMQIDGDKMKDIIIIEKIICSLKLKLNFIMCSIEESKNIDELSIDKL